jgi:monoamine oxidase
VTTAIATNQTILVVGGGIGGMTAALEAAECGKQVILVERNATLGGRTALLYRYFPKMCQPTCGLEINMRRLKANSNLKVMTQSWPPVVYYSQLMSLAYGGSMKQAGLDGHVIQPERLQKIAERKNNQHELGIS